MFLVFHHLGQVSRLSARCGAGVEHPLTGPGAEEMRNDLGSLILHEIEFLPEEAFFGEEGASPGSAPPARTRRGEREFRRL